MFDILYEGLDSGKMVGSKCPKCAKIYFPPSGFCKDCSVFTNEYLELPDTAVLINFSGDGLIKSRKKRKKNGITHKIVGLVQIDTTEIRMMIQILNAQPEELYEGIKLKAVWKKRPESCIQSYIAGYEPIRTN
jgi:uncharacterized OB-fold protein